MIVWDSITATLPRTLPATLPRTLPVAEFVARFGPYIGGSRRRVGDWQQTAAGLWERRPDYLAELRDSVAVEGIREPVRVRRLQDYPRYVGR